MRGLWVVVVAALGCDSDAPGALIVVHSDVATTRYELAYSLRRCPECASKMAPPSRSFQPIENAVGWLSDDMDRFPIELTEARDVARFQLQTASAEDLLVERAVIVALEGNTPVERETVLGVATIGPFTVPPTDSVKFDVDLLPADRAFETSTGSEHVEFWRADLTRPACVLVQHASGAEYWGPTGDPDCDDKLLGGSVECTEYGYLSYALPKLAAASCLAHDAELHCRIGGPPCLEAPQNGVPPGFGTCMPVEPSYCLPQNVCEVSCTPLDSTCFGNVPAGGPGVGCEVYTGNGAPCPTTRTRVQLQELVSDTPTRSCKSIEVANVAKPPMFGTRVLFGDGGALATFSIDPLSFDPATCSIDATWSGTFNYSSVALIKVVTDGDVNRVVPWRVVFKSSVCPANLGPSFNCTAAHGLSTDSLYTCD